tara:strand:+ start:3855 stop:4883 length:1029 start_codon:yes stop_codon:yes gene_type:complete
MKKFVSFLLSLAMSGSLFAQMSGYSTSSYSDGTTLGANETLTADGIALGNAVKLRGYVDFILGRAANDDNGTDSNSDTTSVSADVDLLIDLSPVTAEVHLNVSEDNGSDILEQAFGRYSFSQDFHLTFGRQVTVLGYDDDEAPGLYAVTTAYSNGAFAHPGKSYVDGIRLNYNNGMFGFIIGLHDEYGYSSLTGSGNDLDDGIAIDLAASVMFMPGLEARLGFVNDNGSSDDDVQQINGWIGWNPGDLTLAFEFDSFSLSNDTDAWNMMLLANYQFSDFLGATLRYAHMDHEADESDRLTLALLFSITENFGMNLEYSYTDGERNGANFDSNEFYLEALLSY